MITKTMYTMTADAARDELRRYALERETYTTIAANVVLEENARLRQLLRDLIDFDMGEAPELDALCAVEGPRKLARMQGAWENAIAEVGQRNQRRFEGDEP